MNNPKDKTTAEVVEEIKPCPYINGFSSENANVSFILKKYDGYSDFILFDNGNPSRCFRFSAMPRQVTMEECVEICSNYPYALTNCIPVIKALHSAGVLNVREG